MKYAKPALMRFSKEINRLNCVGGSGNTVTSSIVACSGGGVPGFEIGDYAVCLNGNSGSQAGETICYGGAGDTGKKVVSNCDVGNIDACANGPDA